MVQPGVAIVTFVKIVFLCLVMGQLLTHVDSKNLLVARIMYIYEYMNMWDLAFITGNFNACLITGSGIRPHGMGRVLACRP